MTVMTVRVPAAIVLAVAPANWTAVKVISLQVILIAAAHLPVVVIVTVRVICRRPIILAQIV